jgi:hypothetical protein
MREIDPQQVWRALQPILQNANQPEHA